MHLYFPNMGGMGLALPQNCISWGMMALLSLVIGYDLLLTKRPIVLTPTLKLFGVVLLLLSIPLLYTCVEWREAALWRWAGLFGGLVFYFSCLQADVSARARYWLFYAILLAVVEQAVMALIQMFGLGQWVPYPLIDGRPYGVFQQVNLLASFTATGLALALMLFLLPNFNLRTMWHEKLRLILLALLLVVFPTLLVWLQSRIGWIGGIAVALLFLYRFHSLNPLRAKWATCLMFLGLLIGVMALLQGEDGLRYVNHDGSNHARHAMLLDTLTMIVQKPLLGWGYGGYEYSLQHFRIAQIPPTVIAEIASHPHNELLLWWVEGGVLGLLCMLLLGFAGLRLACKAWRRCRQGTGVAERGVTLALCFVLLPIALHTQTEYPFYLSTLHWCIFLLLLAMLDRSMTPASEQTELSGLRWKIPAILLPVGSVIILIVMQAGLLGGMTLTRAEKNKFTDMRDVMAMPPVISWIQDERRTFDQQVYALLLFNQTQDEKLLSDYALWAKGYLKRHIDKNVYAALLLILKHQGKDIQAEQLRREAILLFPDDPRFM